MGTLKVNGDISATGTISASSFLGNASSSTYTHQWRTTAENPCTTSTDSSTGIFNVPDSRVYWISKTGTVIDQLNQWGYILDIGNNAERHQIWMTQSSGDMAHRGGNSNGWSGSWRVLLDSINYTSYTVTKTGSGASGTWGINITGNSNTVGGYQASSFLLKAGDTMTGNLTAPTYIATQKMTISGTGLVDLTAAGTTRLYADGIAISNPSTKNDDAWIRVTGTSELDTILEIATGDDGGGAAGNGPEQIVVRQYGANGLAHQITLMDTSGNTSTSGTITASSFIGNLSGNASSATNADKLDGYHASSFALSGHTHNYLPWNIYAGATDFNTVTTTAFNSMCATGGANQPNPNHGLLITDFNVGTPIQIWYPDLSMAMYKRYRSSGTWSAWSNTWDINISGTAATANSVAWGNVTGKPSLMPGTPGSIELYPGSSAGHGGFIDFHYNNSSSDYTARIINWNGMLQVSGATFNVGGKVELWSDGEGGNIRITSPNGSLWSIDALENSKLRFIWAEAQVPFSFQHDGVFNCAAIATSAWGPSLPGSGYWGQVYFKT